MDFSYQLARFRWLRDRYRHARLVVEFPGCRFVDATGQKFGHLEEVRLREGRLFLRGWTLAEHVRVRLGQVEMSRRPCDERGDVAAALGCGRHLGFQISLPFEDAPLVLELVRDGQTVHVAHDMQAGRFLKRAERRMNRDFLRDMVPLLPTLILGLVRGDPDLPRRVKTRLNIGGTLQVETQLDPAFLARPNDPQAPQSLTAEAKRPAVILPVYNAFDLLPETLQRLRDHTDFPCEVIVIEDCSPDPQVRPFLRDWAARAQGCLSVTLIENEANLGFIGSVNRGFSLVKERGHDGPLILLNSDAMVPAGWLRRLIAPLGDPAVASVTPLSNDAEIFGAPILCRPTPLATGQGDRIDARLRDLIAPLAPEVPAPTGVGFCMAVSGAWLQRLGGFDPVFGRGYGEEVDWCRRAAAMGGRHVAVLDLFVEHRGGASFGPEKLALVQRNNAVISARYPDYDQLVQEFIRTDPLITPRLVAALLWADSLPDVAEIPVFIAHSMGGGAEKYLQNRLHSTPVSVVLRFGGAFRCRIELDSPAGLVVANADDLDLVVRVIRTLSKRRVIYSCAVGDPDLSQLPQMLCALAGTAPLDLLFHDYLPLSPSYTLLDSDGVYRGVPGVDRMDPAHRYQCADGRAVSLRDWRARWGQAVDAAERLVVFSRSSAQIVAEGFPEHSRKIEVAPHDLPDVIPSLPSPDGPRCVIGVLGAIGPQKGAAVVSALARAVSGNAKLDLALIGRIAPGFPLGAHVPCHGAYAIDDIPALAARYGITHWLIPSIWPETFSYTVHECLATGLPTLAFDLGAQGDAVRSAPNGILIAAEPGQRQPEELAQLVLCAILDHLPLASAS